MLKQYKMICFASLFLLCMISLSVIGTADASAPNNAVRLIFIHHSVGENWLSDSNGGLGIALRDNNYYVSDTYYDWGPDQIGSNTDIGNWWQWFRGPDSAKYLNALYSEDQQISAYSHMSTNPGGENQVIMLKSCFPNSALQGNVNDPVPSIDNNPLRGEGSGSDFHTVANAKGIYIDLLEYFKTRPDKLFVVITAPPLIDGTYADNARALNNWLVNSWLSNYSLKNVFVFDFYNVLTTNGGSPDVNDLNQATGNHHRLWNGEIQHQTNGDQDATPNTSEYPTGDDDHPSVAGNQKATAEFVPLLNYAYSQASLSPPISSSIPGQETSASPTLSQQDGQETSPQAENAAIPVEYIILASFVIILVVALASIFRVRTRKSRLPLYPPTPPVSQ
jgi:hypothetical protein